MSDSRRQAALDGALQQIYRAFGKEGLACERCGKKLSKKRLRVIDGKPMCSACVLPPMRKSGVTRMGEDPQGLRERSE